MPQAGRQQQTWSPTSLGTLQGMGTCNTMMGGVYVSSMYVCEYTYVSCSFMLGGTGAPMLQEAQSAVQQTADLIVCKLHTA